MSSLVITPGLGAFPSRALVVALSSWFRVMYVSMVIVGCGDVSWTGGVTSKLSGFCDGVHGACGRWYGDALYYSVV